MRNFAYIIVIIILVAGCSQGQEKLRVSYHAWPGYEALCIAEQAGVLNDVVLIRSGSASDSISKLKKGLADGAALTLDEVIRANDDGLSLVVVLVFDISSGADKVIADRDINKLENLKGLRVAVEYSALGALVLSKFLEDAKLSESDIEIVQAPVSEHVNLWKNNLIDASVSFPPVSDRLLDLDGVEIYNSKKMPEMIFDVLAVKKSVLKERPEPLRNLIKEYFRVISGFDSNNYNFFYKVASCMNVNVQQVSRSFKELIIPGLSKNHNYLEQPNSSLRYANVFLQKKMTEWKIIDNMIETDFFDSSFLPAGD